LVALALVAAGRVFVAHASRLTEHNGIGACTLTTVSYVGWRAEGIPSSGSTIRYANGLWQVSYIEIAGIDHSRIGDSVRLCLTDVPQACPPGDGRGLTYKGTNLRTRESWSALNSEHSCGGA
jgi:hypothetical protein